MTKAEKSQLAELEQLVRSLTIEVSNLRLEVSRLTRQTLIPPVIGVTVPEIVGGLQFGTKYPPMCKGEFDERCA